VAQQARGLLILLVMAVVAREEKGREKVSGTF
jgi:hypothetical protein